MRFSPKRRYSERLTETPFRSQKTDEPATVVHVAATVAGVKGMSVREVDQTTTDNAASFFGWPLTG